MTTYNYKGTTLQLSDIDGDFDVCASLFDGWPIRLESIQFNPSNTGNKLVVKEGNATGPEMFNFNGVAGDETIKQFRGTYAKPYVHFSESTLVATDNVILNIT